MDFLLVLIVSLAVVWCAPVRAQDETFHDGDNDFSLINTFLKTLLEKEGRVEYEIHTVTVTKLDILEDYIKNIVIEGKSDSLHGCTINLIEEVFNSTDFTGLDSLVFTKITFAVFGKQLFNGSGLFWYDEQYNRNIPMSSDERHTFIIDKPIIIYEDLNVTFQFIVGPKFGSLEEMNTTNYSEHDYFFSDPMLSQVKLGKYDGIMFTTLMHSPETIIADLSTKKGRENFSDVLVLFRAITEYISDLNDSFIPKVDFGIHHHRKGSVASLNYNNIGFLKKWMKEVSPGFLSIDLIGATKDFMKNPQLWGHCLSKGSSGLCNIHGENHSSFETESSGFKDQPSFLLSQDWIPEYQRSKRSECNNEVVKEGIRQIYNKSLKNDTQNNHHPRWKRSPKNMTEELHQGNRSPKNCTRKFQAQEGKDDVINGVMKSLIEKDTRLVYGIETMMIKVDDDFFNFVKNIIKEGKYDWLNNISMNVVEDMINATTLNNVYILEFCNITAVLYGKNLVNSESSNWTWHDKMMEENKDISWDDLVNLKAKQPVLKSEDFNASFQFIVGSKFQSIEERDTKNYSEQESSADYKRYILSDPILKISRRRNYEGIEYSILILRSKMFVCPFLTKEEQKKRAEVLGLLHGIAFLIMGNKDNSAHLAARRVTVNYSYQGGGILINNSNVEILIKWIKEESPRYLLVDLIGATKYFMKYPVLKKYLKKSHPLYYAHEFFDWEGNGTVLDRLENQPPFETQSGFKKSSSFILSRKKRTEYTRTVFASSPMTSSPTDTIDLSLE